MRDVVSSQHNRIAFIVEREGKNRTPNLCKGSCCEAPLSSCRCDAKLRPKVQQIAPAVGAPIAAIAWQLVPQAQIAQTRSMLRMFAHSMAIRILAYKNYRPSPLLRSIRSASKTATNITKNPSINPPAYNGQSDSTLRIPLVSR